MKFLQQSGLILILWLAFHSFSYTQENNDSISSWVPSPSNNEPIFRDGFYEAVEKTMFFCKTAPSECDIITNSSNNNLTEEEVKAKCRQNPDSCGIKLGPNDDGSTEEGIKQCQNDPASCNITVNQNQDGFIAEGIKQCQNDPAFCQIEIDQNQDGSIAEGIAQCQNDPVSCHIERNQNQDGSTADGIVQCQNDPSSCDITIYYNLDGSNQEGIKQCQNDPLSCGIPANPNLNEIIATTKAQCQANPASCGIDVNNCSVTTPEQSCGPIIVHSFFSLEDGSLSIPAVDVLTAFDGTITTYEVKMKLISGFEPLSFSILSIVPIQK